METPAQNIQDSFLNTARKEKAAITLYLLSGVKLTGRIRSFDKYCLVLDSPSQEQLVFKHAISTVVLQHAALREAGDRHAAHAPAPRLTPANPGLEAVNASPHPES